MTVLNGFQIITPSSVGDHEVAGLDCRVPIGIEDGGMHIVEYAR